MKAIGLKLGNENGLLWKTARLNYSAHSVSLISSIVVGSSDPVPQDDRG